MQTLLQGRVPAGRSPLAHLQCLSNRRADQVRLADRGERDQVDAIHEMVKQIGGELQIGRGDNDQGARFTILFSIQPLANGTSVIQPPVNGTSIADKHSVEQAMKIAAE